METRAEMGDGSCREIMSGRQMGKWRVQYRITEPSGRRRRLSRIFDTKTEARTFLRDLRHGRKIEAKRQSQELTLAAWFDWLVENDWSEALAENTIGYRRARFARYVDDHLGGVPLSRIDALQVRAFYQALRKQGLSASLICAIKTDLVRVFNQAISPYQRIPTSIANPFRLSLTRPVTRQAVALTPQEVKKAIRSPNLSASQRAQLSLFLLAGLRLGEVMAITCGQLRFRDNLITVDRAVQVAFGGAQTVGLPKGRKTRNVVMCMMLREILQEHCKGLNPDGLLWPAATENKPRMKKLVYATWRTILRDAKLPPEMSPHDCRLTHINVIEKLMPNVSTTTLKEHVGHAATGVTEANYTRPLTSAQSILRKELDRVFGGR